MTALAAPLTPEWFAARRLGVSASEIAAVMGLSPWESPLSLYWRKRQGWEVAATSLMDAGNLLEPVIADWWLAQTPLAVTLRSPGLLAHPDRPWQMATADRTIHLGCGQCGGSGVTGGALCDECWGEGIWGAAISVLECKWVAYSWDGWGEPGTDDIPVHYRAQVLWQCDVLDVETWTVAALGPGGFREYEGVIDHKDLVLMREYGRRFVDRVRDGDPPPLDDHPATLATIKRLHPDLEDRDADVPADVAAGYARALAAERLAKRLKGRYEARLRDAMGSARRAVHGGAFVASRSIYDVAEHAVAGHRVDRLNPPRAKKGSNP